MCFAEFRPNDAVEKETSLEANHTPDDFNYASAFAAFVARSTEYGLAKEWCAGDSTSVFRSSVKRVLSIGAGTGHFDLDSVVPSLPELERYDVVENNAAQMEGFRQNLGAAQVHNAVEFGLYEKLFDKDFEPSERYDMVLLFHVLYYFPDPKEALQHIMKRCLKPGGRLVIFHQTPVGIHAIQRYMGQHKNHYSSVDISRHLHELGEDFSVDELPSGFFVDDLPDPVIDFILEHRASESERRRVQDYIAQNAVRVTDESGRARSFLEHPCAVIQVTASHGETILEASHTPDVFNYALAFAAFVARSTECGLASAMYSGPDPPVKPFALIGMAA